MSDENERSVASTGSVAGGPVAYQAVDEYGRPYGYAQIVLPFGKWPKSQRVPLYSLPQPTLTDEEREAIERAIETLDGWQKTGGYHSAIEDDAATLRGLLDRLKPIGSGDCDRPKPIEHTQETQATPCKCRVRTKGTCE